MEKTGIAPVELGTFDDLFVNVCGIRRESADEKRYFQVVYMVFTV